MKKLISTTTGLIAPFLLALPAYATGAVQCPSSVGNICNLTASKFGSVVSQIINILVIVAVVISIFILLWGGIKWIMSGGDKAKVESARSTIIAGIVGLVLVFLAYFIISVVAKIFNIDITNIVIPTIG